MCSINFHDALAKFKLDLIAFEWWSSPTDDFAEEPFQLLWAVKASEATREACARAYKAYTCVPGEPRTPEVALKQDFKDMVGFMHVH